MYSEYHNILATMIQQKWKKFILQKKLRSFINPTEKSLKIKQKQSVLLNKTFKRIHHDTSYFKTMVVKHDIITSIKNIEITYKSENVYSIYDLDTQVIYNCGYLKVMEEFKKINNIISMKIQAIICDLNIYRYPEIISISVC